MQTTIRKEEKEGGEGERTDTSGLGRVVLAVFETRAARGTASSPRLRRIRISLCPLYRIPLSRQPIQTRYPNESFVVRGPGIYIYMFYSRSFLCTYTSRGSCARWLYQRGRIIQFYPETTHLYAFVWLNLPPPRRFLSPSRPDFHPVRLFIRLLPPLLLSLRLSSIQASLSSFPPSADTNAVSCFNFPSPRKTERRARHPPCPIHPRRFYFSLPPPQLRAQSDLPPARKTFPRPDKTSRKCTLFFRLILRMIFDSRYDVVEWRVKEMRYVK